MNEILLTSVITLTVAGATAGAILYLISRFFHVEEDPLVKEVEELLPGANCGACGLPGGCSSFAREAVKARHTGTVGDLYCPAGGEETMSAIAELLNITPAEKEPTIAVLHCQGSYQNTEKRAEFEGINSCRLAHQMFAGESGCPVGCLGLGDCVRACGFDALHINTETGLPEVDPEKCTSCGACVTACPRDLFEIRPHGPEGRRVYVACRNTQKGALARKVCKAACIACMKCTKITDDETVKVENNLSTISPDMDVGKHGPELVGCCPTGAIVGVGITPVKPARKKTAKKAKKAAGGEAAS